MTSPSARLRIARAPPRVRTISWLARWPLACWRPGRSSLTPRPRRRPRSRPRRSCRHPGVLVVIDLRQSFTRELCVDPGADRLARLSHQLQVIVKVVHAQKPWTERVAALEELVQVAPAEGP